MCVTLTYCNVNERSMYQLIIGYSTNILVSKKLIVAIKAKAVQMCNIRTLEQPRRVEQVSAGSSQYSGAVTACLRVERRAVG